MTIKMSRGSERQEVQTNRQRMERIYLSPPHMGDLEEALVADAFASNWIAPLGPHVDAFEREFCTALGVRHATALSSGTAAIHLGLTLLGVQPADEVLVSTFTFAASVFPIRYVGARPVFVDSERESWSMDPQLLREALARRARAGKLPKAVIVAHIYGQCADMDSILEACDRYAIPVLEDAAESLGATCRGRWAGTMGTVGAYSFNGNKMITTSGGGMLVSGDERLVSKARKLATQAREDHPHYEHVEVGYNYRMSNVLAAIGRGQLAVLPERIRARRDIFQGYVDGLSDLPGLTFMPEAPWGTHARWLSTVLVDPEEFGMDREQLRQTLERKQIESRPLWKPMHLQPVFDGCESLGGSVAEDLFRSGLCLPSGSSLSSEQQGRIIEAIRDVAGGPG